MPDQHLVKSWLPHTWSLFFARHGSFTPVQRQAIPPILQGKDTLVVAATASGKTEAVVAPLLERYWLQLNRPDQYGLRILYICPTRALVRDLYERLHAILVETGVTVAMKTGDTAPVDAGRPPAILLTTPESIDSLLTRVPRLFTQLEAIVLDEIHLFDNTPRGDHTRCLLLRLERIRQYANAGALPAQRVALSATVPEPDQVAKRYLAGPAVVVDVPGGRRIEARIVPLYDLASLVEALAGRALLPQPTRKSLIFCNTRNEVEQTAAYLRQHLPYHAETYVHYSNLDAQLRREVEERFAAAPVAVCVCTSTLELGIDIGTVDDVILLGAPHHLTSFLQRIGRGSRRKPQMRVLCLPKSPGEWARFEALLALADPANQEEQLSVTDERGEIVSTTTGGAGEPVKAWAYGFRPSVLIQQIFSLIKQSPAGSIRLADVRRIAPGEVESETIREIIAQLSLLGYLRTGRLGEWKPGDRLQELIDRHEIYSNIGTDLLAATAVDAYTGAVLGQSERVYEKGTVVLFGGRSLEVVWREQSRFGLVPARGKQVDEVLRFRTAAAAIPFAVTQAVARLLEIGEGQGVTLQAAEGMWLFHFWGTVWGELLTDLLLAHAIAAESVNEYCLFLQPALSQLPAWDEDLFQRVATNAAVTLAGRLEMGRFHELLPANVAVAATLRQLNLEEWQRVYRTTTCVPAAAGLREKLHMLAQTA